MARIYHTQGALYIPHTDAPHNIHHTHHKALLPQKCTLYITHMCSTLTIHTQVLHTIYTAYTTYIYRIYHNIHRIYTTQRCTLYTTHRGTTCSWLYTLCITRFYIYALCIIRFFHILCVFVLDFPHMHPQTTDFYQTAFAIENAGTKLN